MGSRPGSSRDLRPTHNTQNVKFLQMTEITKKLHLSHVLWPITTNLSQAFKFK